MTNASSSSYNTSDEKDEWEYHYPNLTGECLEDRSRNGRLKPWQQHKQTTEKLGECYTYLRWKNKAVHWTKKAVRVFLCATYLDFKECRIDNSHPKKLVDANFCKDRMCSQCQWRKSMRQFTVAVKVGHELRRRERAEGKPESQFIFLTLTIPNVTLDKLSDAIDGLFAGWKRLYERKEVRKISMGYHRALEISYNAKTDTFHPHIHAAIVVSPHYFAGRTYIKQQRWLELWREAMRMPEITQVDVRKIRGKKGQDEIRSGFGEACKYSLKYWASTLTRAEQKRIKKEAKATGVNFGMQGHIWLRNTLEESADVVEMLSRAIHRRRLVQFGGILRDIKRELKLKDAEEGGDLVNTSDEKTQCNCPVCGADTINHVYRWFSDVREYIG